MKSAQCSDLHDTLADLPTLAARRAGPLFDGFPRTTELILGESNLQPLVPEIGELRLRCGQQGDRTTDLQYFITANIHKNKKPAAVLIRRELQLEACVFFYEHCRFGIGLGFWRGGDPVGDGLFAGPTAFQVQYVQLATSALFRHWRIHGISLAIAAPLNQCTEILGPATPYRWFGGREVQRKLPLKSTYHAMLQAMGPRTRRSLAGKRQQLEKREHVCFIPCLDDTQALEGMLRLRSRSLPYRIPRFYHARRNLLRQTPEFFCMGLRAADSTWLSLLSGWRQDRVTYVDLQMNDLHFKKESISAVMRAFLLEHEIACQQEIIHFVGGTSLLLRRYCQPVEPCTDVLLLRPCLRATLFRLATPRLLRQSVYDRIQSGDTYESVLTRHST